jgi:hypothetical protein
MQPPKRAPQQLFADQPAGSNRKAGSPTAANGSGRRLALRDEGDIAELVLGEGQSLLLCEVAERRVQSEQLPGVLTPIDIPPGARPPVNELRGRFGEITRSPNLVAHRPGAQHGAVQEGVERQLQQFVAKLGGRSPFREGSCTGRFPRPVLECSTRRRRNLVLHRPASAALGHSPRARHTSGGTPRPRTVCRPGIRRAANLHRGPPAW